MAANIRLIKMISGEDLIAEVVVQTGNEIIVKNPVRVVVMPSKTNPQSPTVGFAPWAEFSDEKQFTIHMNHVIVTMKPIQEFINQFNSMFSGILLPEKKIIV
jgi:hypothetical protein